MLPTYPNIVRRRAELNKMLMKALVAAKAPMLASISSHIIHEGGGSDIVRADGTAEETEIAKASFRSNEIRLIVRFRRFAPLADLSPGLRRGTVDNDGFD